MPTPRLPLRAPPDSVCILRLSAVGDICHTLPAVRALQDHWPDTRLTWVIGRVEHGLVGDIPGIEFITFDKSQGWRAYRALRRALRARRFDVLLHMQMSLRASLASLTIPARLRMGFPRRYAKDMQWLFTNCTAREQENPHVMDSLMNFVVTLGVPAGPPRWDIPLPAPAREFAAAHLPGDRPALVISPCSSMAYRNWTVAGYAAVADHAVENHGMQVILCGGPSAFEADFAAAIQTAARAPLDNLVGQTDLKQLAALLARARVVLAPDSGPAHLSTAVGTPVIGLYAATNPERAGPWRDRHHVVSRYAEAIQARYGKMPAQLGPRLPWGTRVRDAGTMARITPEEVCAMLDRVLAETP